MSEHEQRILYGENWLPVNDAAIAAVCATLFMCAFRAMVSCEFIKINNSQFILPLVDATRN